MHANFCYEITTNIKELNFIVRLLNRYHSAIFQLLSYQQRPTASIKYAIAAVYLFVLLADQSTTKSDL